MVLGVRQSGSTRAKRGCRALLPLVAVALLLVVGLAWLQTSGLIGVTKDIDPNDPAQVALGKKIYAAACASCHGEELKGEEDWQVPRADGTYPAPPHDGSGHTWHHADALLVDYTKHGGAIVIGGEFKSGMPGFGDQLSDEEIRAVIAFIKSTWPQDIRQRQEENNRG